MWLNDEDRKLLNDIYARAYKKYNTGSTEGLEFSLLAQAESYDAHKRVERVCQRYDEQVARINANAAKRGMLSSTVVLEQLDRALERCNTEVSAIENKLFIENRKFSLAIEKERSAAASRGFRNMLELVKARATATVDSQTFIDEEVYAEYFAWLGGQDRMDAVAYVQNDPLFVFNLSSTYYNKLLQEMKNRAGIV